MEHIEELIKLKELLTLLEARVQTLESRVIPETEKALQSLQEALEILETRDPKYWKKTREFLQGVQRHVNRHGFITLRQARSVQATLEQLRKSEGTPVVFHVGRQPSRSSARDRKKPQEPPTNQG